MKMSEVSLDGRISEKCNNAILISGSARSGTTIFGKILHTFHDVEYIYEPPMLFSLFALIEKLCSSEWKLLYETYLYEEFLMNSLAGRGLNCNRIDDSSIYNVKPVSLIEERLNRTLRKIDADVMAQNSRIIYKMPDIVPFLRQLKDYYPKTRLIIMLRKAPDVFSSLLEKGWFSNTSLRDKNLIWPNRMLKGMRIPFWVEIKDSEEWIEMDELHRVAYYYITVNSPVEKLQDCIKVKYDNIVENPHATVKAVSDELGILWGEKTDEVINTVKRKRTGTDYGILKELRPDVREKVEYYSDIS
jgi:hypothetical protein